MTPESEYGEWLNPSPLKITVSSPFSHSPNADRYAADPYYQHDLVRMALRQALSDPFEQGWDLRGKQIRVTVHDDGLHATAEVVPGA